MSNMNRISKVLTLLAFLFESTYSQPDFGYLECTYNSYRAVCLGNFVETIQERRGLTAFPVLTKRETCVKLKDNIIERFPDDLSNLKTVVTLDLAGNSISNLPKDLTIMSGLEIMDLSRNRLTSLSPATRFPVSLRGLLLARNNMVTLPAGIQVPGLFVLDLSGNQFKDIPEHFCVSNQFIRVDLTNNPLSRDLSYYMKTINKCRNVNKIPFCLFTDVTSVECSCSSIGPILVGTPAFCLGTTLRGQDMQCSKSGSELQYGGKKLFDLDIVAIKQNCSTEALYGSNDSNNTACHGQTSKQMIAISLMLLLIMSF